MNASFDEIIRHTAHPIEPIQTNETSVLRRLTGIRAVMFDIYGTLLISASGDIGADDSTVKGQAFCEALSAVGIQFNGDGDAGAQLLIDEIQSENNQAQQNGIDYPEVDIVANWGQVLSRIGEVGLTGDMDPKQTVTTDDFTVVKQKRLALEYEMRVNPVWPMPHARECLDRLYQSGLRLGIISNAQFFTIEILQTLLPAESGGFEFDEKLQYYSFQHRRAKPGLELYKSACEGLAQRGIHESEVLYIGNDMLKDVMPAACIGFRTALFAGDARSLRLRKDDARVDGISPDLVITDLLDLPNCIL